MAGTGDMLAQEVLDLMTGLVLLWSGAVVDIPEGFQLCDGTNGSPDLRNRFIIGAGDTYNPNDSGGNLIHTHTFGGDGHFHSAEAGTDIQTGTGADTVLTGKDIQGITDNPSTPPPYYSLAYITRI